MDTGEVPDRFPSLASAQVAEGFGPVAALPLLTGARPIGGLAFRFPVDRVVDDDDRSFALTLTEECSEAMERARLYEAEQRARARAEQLAAERAAILGQIADGVVIADHQGRIAFANVTARSLLGRTDEALIGVDLDRITGSKDGAAEIGSAGARAAGAGRAHGGARRRRGAPDPATGWDDRPGRGQRDPGAGRGWYADGGGAHHSRRDRQARAGSPEGGAVRQRLP